MILFSASLELNFEVPIVFQKRTLDATFRLFLIYGANDYPLIL